MEETLSGAAPVGALQQGRELLEFIEQRLYTAVISDSLDELGTRHQAMREYLRPVHAGCRFAGWARTIACVDSTDIPIPPYEREIEAVDGILPDEVVVVSTGHSITNAPWGELLSTAALARGARGAVIDGLARDIQKIEALGFPVFAAGIKPVDSLGRGVVSAINEPVECGEVIVHPGDLIVADYDGVLVIPESMVNDVVRLAAEKVGREDASRAELSRGAYLRDVYRKYGVL